MEKLHNVRGRITYISSHAKQENLYAVYETTDRHYWTELARFNQQEFLKSGTKGNCKTGTSDFQDTDRRKGTEKQTVL